MNIHWTIIPVLLIILGSIGGATYWSTMIVDTTYQRGWDDGFARGQNMKMQHRIVPETEPGKSAQPKG